MNITRSLIALVVLLLVTGTMNRWVRSSRAQSAQTVTPPDRPLEALPFRLGAFIGQDIPLRTDVMKAARTDESIHREYVDQNSGRRLLLYVGYWGQENVGMGHGPEICYPSAGWSVDGPVDIQTFPSRDNQRRTVDQPIAYHRFVRTTLDGHDRALVGFLAVSNGRVLPRSRGLFWHRPKSSKSSPGHYLAHVHIASFPSTGDWEHFEGDIRQFVELVWPYLTQSFPGMSESSTPGMTQDGLSGPERARTEF